MFCRFAFDRHFFNISICQWPAKPTPAFSIVFSRASRPFAPQTLPDRINCPCAPISPRRNSAQCGPIIAAPAKHASNRMKPQHAEKAVKWAQLGRLEFERFTVRAFAPYPKNFWHPMGAVPALISLSAHSFSIGLLSGLRFALTRSLRQATREDAGCCR